MTYTAPTPPPPSQRPQPGRGPWWRATWALLAGGLLVGLIIGGSAGASSAKTKTKTVTVAGPTQYATETATATVTETLTATPTVIKTIATQTHVVTVTFTPAAVTAFGDGTFIVGREVRPGLYHTDPQGSQCYWEADDSGGNILDNNNIDGPTTITVRSSWYSLTTNGGCNWSPA